MVNIDQTVFELSLLEQKYESLEAKVDLVITKVEKMMDEQSKKLRAISVLSLIVWIASISLLTAEFYIRAAKMPVVPSQRSLMASQATHVETTNNVRVTATTFYLGQDAINGQMKHCWRYVVRLENLDGTDLILRDRQFKVFSLNNLTQVNGGGVVGEYPRLSTADPAYQFISTVQLLQKNGSQLWDKFKLEKEEDGTTFEVNMPTLLLESNSPQNSHENNENVV